MLPPRRRTQSRFIYVLRLGWRIGKGHGRLTGGHSREIRSFPYLPATAPSCAVPVTAEISVGQSGRLSCRDSAILRWWARQQIGRATKETPVRRDPARGGPDEASGLVNIIKVCNIYQGRSPERGMPTKSRGGAARRPKPSAAGKADVPGKKAGTTAGRAVKTAADAELVPVLLRIPPKVLARVDRLVKARRAENPIPRTTWLLEAVVEKLAREEKAEE